MGLQFDFKGLKVSIDKEFEKSSLNLFSYIRKKIRSRDMLNNPELPAIKVRAIKSYLYQ